MTAADVKWRLPQNVWNSYFKFTIVRNPWDYAVSKFFFAQRHQNERIPFDDWIRLNISNDGMDFYSIGGEVAVDHVLRYENLNADLANCLQKLGVETIPELPKAKSGFRPKGTDYREVHTAFTKSHVEKVCGRMIEYFGYKF